MTQQPTINLPGHRTPEPAPPPDIARLALHTQLAIEAFRELLMADNRLERARRKVEHLLAKVPDHERDDYDEYTRRLEKSFRAHA